MSTELENVLEMCLDVVHGLQLTQKQYMVSGCVESLSSLDSMCLAIVYLEAIKNTLYIFKRNLKQPTNIINKLMYDVVALFGRTMITPNVNVS